MNPELVQYLQQPFTSLPTQMLSQVSLFLPRLLAALLIVIVGAAVARWIKSGVINVLSAAKVSKLIEKTPVEHFLKNADLSHRLEVVLGGVVYWLLMLIVLHTTVAVLGLEPLSVILDRVLGYIPNIVSAVLVLFLGLLLAGVVESMVKGAIRSMDGSAALLLGKVSSYLVMVMTLLIAVSELGIASEYIMILFVGVITSLSLGAGLALGLGGKELVHRILVEWYQRNQQK